MIKLTITEIKQYFDRQIFNRGNDYFKSLKVSGLILRGNTLSGNVNGSGANKYKVEIYFGISGIIEKMICSCPYEYNCKHEAAALIHFIRIGPQKTIKNEMKNPLF